MSKPWSFGSLLALRCPECGQDTFKAGLYHTAKTCASCGFVFEPETGFYAGAIYPLYGGSVILGGLAFTAVTLLWDWGFGAALGAAAGAVLLASPFLFKLSRLAFIHTNHRFFREGH
jgi:uncharacterized protein (DUF983 family)